MSTKTERKPWILYFVLRVRVILGRPLRFCQYQCKAYPFSLQLQMDAVTKVAAAIIIQHPMSEPKLEQKTSGNRVCGTPGPRRRMAPSGGTNGAGRGVLKPKRGRVGVWAALPTTNSQRVSGLGSRYMRPSSCTTCHQPHFSSPLPPQLLGCILCRFVEVHGG